MTKGGGLSGRWTHQGVGGGLIAIAGLVHATLISGAMVLIGYPLLVIDSAGDLLSLGWLLFGLVVVVLIPGILTVRVFSQFVLDC